MTQEQISELGGVPKLLGRPLYPVGCPLRPDSISFMDNNLQDLWHKRVDDIHEGRVPDFDEETILKNYVLYYIHAPVFESEFTQELKDTTDFDEISLDNLIMKSLDFGLDPF